MKKKKNFRGKRALETSGPHPHPVLAGLGAPSSERGREPCGGAVQCVSPSTSDHIRLKSI